MPAKISIIIPTRNEEPFIGKVLENIISQDYPFNEMEVFVIDGESEDNTTDIIGQFAARYPNIHLINNPERVVPYALNYGLKQCSGEVIIRMDAHSVYPSNYVSRLVEVLGKYEADNVGGVWITTPANDSMIARAIALATSHKFGIGDANYRLKNKQIREVDTVPFGCYRKEVFDKIGNFDTDLIRNQDDEFNARLKKHGGKILLVPDVGITYFARATLGKMMKMFYHYGLFKPLVSRKVGSPATVRQFIPPLFVLFLLFALALPFLPQVFAWLWCALFGAYAVAAVFASLSLAMREKDVRLFFVLPVVFFLIHLSYGIGYLKGAILLYLFGRKPGGAHFGTSR